MRAFCGDPVQGLEEVPTCQSPSTSGPATPCPTLQGAHPAES